MIFMITQFIIDLFPENDKENGFQKPYGYIFRGIFMKWLKSYDLKITDRLHHLQPKGTPLFFQKYALRYKRIYKNLKSQDNKKQEGMRYIINSFDSEISQTLVDFMYKQEQKKFQLGPQVALIKKVIIRQIDWNQLKKDAIPIKSIKMAFKTPVSFNIMGVDFEMRIPLPIYVFNSLMKQWNQHFLGKDDEIPREFYQWVENNVFLGTFRLESLAWKTKKPVPFIGSVGAVNYIVKHPEKKYCEWMHILSRFAEYCGIGLGRTAGFGQTDIITFVPLK